MPPKPMTTSQRDLLWLVAQHKYGWAYVNPYRGGFQIADALVRRGLVSYSDDYSVVIATIPGRYEIKRRWPVSPFALGTYEHQPDGWTPKEGLRVTNDRSVADAA